MIGLGGYGGNCSPCNTDTYAEIDWTKDKRNIVFNIDTNLINFNAILSKRVTFDSVKYSDVQFSINKSKDILFSINTNDIKFTVAQLACG